MNSDMEELAREGMRQATATLHAPPDLAARTYEQHKRRRRAGFTGLGVAGAAAGTALALGLTSVLGPARPPGTIKTASFTLVSNANGTATLTINPKELLDPAALQNDFQQYGIPAVVTTGSLCTSDSAPAGFSQAVTSPGPGTGEGTPQSGEQPTITIDPSAIPAGTELSVGDFQLSSGEQLADFVLINTNSYTCSNTPPDPNGMPSGYGQDDGIGLLYGGPGPSGS